MQLHFDTMENGGESEQVAELMSSAFALSTTITGRWLSAAGASRVRIAMNSGQRVAGVLLEVPMGQWFGSRSVPTVGIAGVAVAPEARGHRVAFELLRNTLQRAWREKVALSTLFPANFGLYRKAGYELAGSRFRHTARLRELSCSPRELDIEPARDSDRDAVRAAYDAVACQLDGYLDRGPYVWSGSHTPLEQRPRGYLARGALGVEGYVHVLPQPAANQRHDLVLTDFIAVTPRAQRQLMRFIVEHRSMADRAIWYGGVADARTLAPADPGLDIDLAAHWMLRIIDIEAAFRSRGFPEINAQVDLCITDNLLPENTGQYRITVAAGKAEVERGGTGEAELDIGALASLYSGFVRAGELARVGRLKASPRSLATLQALFSGPAPAMCDAF
jgi:predicted acetyltransferase